MPENLFLKVGAFFGLGSVLFVAAVVVKSFWNSKRNFNLYLRVINKGERIQKDLFQLLSTFTSLPFRTANILSAEIRVEDYEDWTNISVNKEEHDFINVPRRLWNVLRILTTLRLVPLFEKLVEEKTVISEKNWYEWLSKNGVKPYEIDNYIWNNFFEIAVSMDQLYRLQQELNGSPNSAQS